MLNLMDLHKLLYMSTNITFIVFFVQDPKLFVCKIRSHWVQHGQVHGHALLDHAEGVGGLQGPPVAPERSLVQTFFIK